MNNLSEKTWIPLGVAIVAIGGAAAWVTSISMSVDASASRMDRLEELQVRTVESLNQIQKELIILRSQIEIMNKGGKYGR